MEIRNPSSLESPAVLFIPNGTMAAEPVMPGCSIVMRVDESLSSEHLSQRDLGEEEN